MELDRRGRRIEVYVHAWIVRLDDGRVAVQLSRERRALKPTKSLPSLESKGARKIAVALTVRDRSRAAITSTFSIASVVADINFGEPASRGTVARVAADRDVLNLGLVSEIYAGLQSIAGMVTD